MITFAKTVFEPIRTKPKNFHQVKVVYSEQEANKFLEIIGEKFHDIRFVRSGEVEAFLIIYKVR